MTILSGVIHCDACGKPVQPAQRHRVHDYGEHFHLIIEDCLPDTTTPPEEPTP